MEIQQSKVGEKLCLVDWVQGFFAFDLNNNLSVNHQVRSESAIEFHRLVDEGQWFLSLNV